MYYLVFKWVNKYIFIIYMFIYWLYSLLVIFYCWLLYNFTKKNIIVIIFYLISVCFIIFHFLTEYLINSIYDKIFIRKLNELQCMENKLKNKKPVCQELYYCENSYFCNSTKEGRCTNKVDIKERVDKKLKEIELEKYKDKENVLKFFDRYYIRKKTLDKSLEIYIIYVSFIFIIIFLLMVNTDIKLDYSSLKMNTIRKKLK